MIEKAKLEEREFGAGCGVKMVPQGMVLNYLLRNLEMKYKKKLTVVRLFCISFEYVSILD